MWEVFAPFRVLMAGYSRTTWEEHCGRRFPLFTSLSLILDAASLKRLIPHLLRAVECRIWEGHCGESSSSFQVANLRFVCRCSSISLNILLVVVAMLAPGGLLWSQELRECLLEYRVLALKLSNWIALGTAGLAAALNFYRCSSRV